MSKMNNRSGSENRGRSKSRGAKRPAGKTSAEGTKRSKYKAGRSFSKNKSFRENKEKDFESKPKRSYSDREDKRSFSSKDKPYREKKEFDGESRSFNSDSKKKSYRENKERDFESKPKRSYSDREEKRSFSANIDKPYREKRDFDGESRPKRSYSDRQDKRDFSSNKDKPYREKSEFNGESRSSSSDKKRSSKKEFKNKEDKFGGFKKANSRESYSEKSDNRDKPAKRRLTKPRKQEDDGFTKRVKHDEFEEGTAFTPQTSREGYGKNRSFKKSGSAKQGADDGLIRLNKYLSNAGIASRRDADNLILSGTVKVNGVVVDKLGTKVSPTDKITYGDSAVKTERKVYLLLNKPKDYITTVEDPKDRKTVMELVRGACRERIYPVGRLDRNTTGLLLFTNDGEMTTKLTHPKFGIKKVYHVSLNKGLKPDDFKAIVEGLELEDGMVKADDLAFVGEGKKEVGIEIHSGRNRIVRRMFEHLGYDVLKLDRVVFAGLTKKDLPRGKHRFLTAKEISFLQMIG